MDIASVLIGGAVGGAGVMLALRVEWRRIDRKRRQLERLAAQINGAAQALHSALASQRQGSLHDRLIANAIQRGSQVL